MFGLVFFKLKNMETNEVLDEMRSYLEVGRSFEHAIESQMLSYIDQIYRSLKKNSLN